MAKTADALKIIDKMIGEDQEQRELIEQATVNCRIAQLIYDARTEAGLTQAQLAELIHCGVGGRLGCSSRRQSTEAGFHTSPVSVRQGRRDLRSVAESL